VHILISEPAKGNPSSVIQVIKQTVARRLLRSRRKGNRSQMELWNSVSVQDRFWQRRFYDFNVFSEAKRTEKLRYMHRNHRGPQQAPGLRLLG
jgi:REP element-mobilizing transposase RayT